MSTQDSSTSYSPIEPDEPIQALALATADTADALKARAIPIIDVRGLVPYADYVIVCHGTSHTRRRHRQRDPRGYTRGRLPLIFDGSSK